jgi:hypothetical protein
MATEITCVVADSPERIDRVGGPGWTKDESIVIGEIEEGRHYFIDVDAAQVTVVVAARGTTKYLSTDPDLTAENNLLSLPACE